MKKRSYIVLALLYSLNAFPSEDLKFTVLKRKAKSNGTFYQDVILQDLTSHESFEGKHFKIVKGKSNEAVRFDVDKTTLLKAATVYYHLSKAKNFWVELTGTLPLHLQDQLIVRIDITNQYDEQGHYAHDNKNPQFNNALSIPAGKTPDFVPPERQETWNNEVWFRPMKKILMKTLPSLGPNPLTSSLQSVEQPFINYTQNRFTQSMLEHIFYPSYAGTPLWVEAVRFAGTIAMTKAVIEASKHMDNLFADKYFYLDTSMVPEVIYHEYTHIVLSDYLVMSHSTPVIEGMADYFAAVLADKRKVYARVRNHSNTAPKDTEADKKLYSHWYESNKEATSDFVLSVLWDVRETLGGKVGDQVVYEARNKLKTNSATINHHLIQAVLDACQEVCESPRRDKLKLYDAFSKKGF